MSRHTEQLFNEVATITDEQTAAELRHGWLDWLKKVRRLEQHEAAKGILKEIRSKRLYYRARKEQEIIKELFYIGFGLYDNKATCNSQQGAQYAFMYGYLSGMKDTEAKFAQSIV